MKYSSLFFAGVAILAAGCASLPGRIDHPADDAPPQIHEFAGTREQVYVAAKKAFRRLDFTLTHAVMGRIEAAGSIHTSAAFGDSRQLVATVTIHESAPGKAEVELAVTEDVSSQSVGGTHHTPLREHSLFGIYFAELQRVLEQDALPGAGDNK